MTANQVETPKDNESDALHLGESTQTANQKTPGTPGANTETPNANTETSNARRTSPRHGTSAPTEATTAKPDTATPRGKKPVTDGIRKSPRGKKPPKTTK